MLVCRGCCCGTDDRDAAAERVQVLGGVVADVPGARIRLTDCLGPCEERDLVAVRHRDTDRPGERLGTTWLARLGDASVPALARWVRAGAPLPVPDVLAANVLDTGAHQVTPDHEISGTPRT